MKSNRVNNMTGIAPEQIKKEKLLYTHLELLFVVAIWAGTFVSTKIVLTQITPAVSALYRHIIASLILLLINCRNKEKIEKRDYPVLFLLGLTGITLYYLLQNYGIKYTNAIDASILVSLSPAFICLISWILLKQQIRPVTIAGLLLAFIGSAFVISNGKVSSSQPLSQLRGNLLILLTAVSWAIYSVYGKKLLAKYNTRTLITYTTVIGTIFLIPFSLFEFTVKTNLNLNWFGWLNMLYLGGAASVYGYLAWYRALIKLPAVTVGSYLYFRPLLTAIIAAIALNERISLAVIFGGVMIIWGTYLTTTKGTQK